jgi:3-methyladenine DNA glycosylase AlkD
MEILSNYIALEATSQYVLDRLETEILAAGHISNWSTADWLAGKVLSKIVFAPGGEHVRRVLDYSRKPNSNLWYRRCGVVSFLKYRKHRESLSKNIKHFGHKLIRSCEACLLASPQERFTQSGVAWVMRYVLVEEQESAEAMEMVVRNAKFWSADARKSLVEKMKESDPNRKKILSLGR